MNTPQSYMRQAPESIEIQPRTRSSILEKPKTRKRRAQGPASQSDGIGGGVSGSPNPPGKSQNKNRTSNRNQGEAHCPGVVDQVSAVPRSTLLQIDQRSPGPILK